MKRIFLCSLVVCLCAACTEPKETTGIGAAAGGALGAGLGAIIGSQTGDAGSGLALGAVAGAATGAAIGNVLQSHEEAIRTQDEALERQQRMLQAQRAELDELRRVGQDHVTFDRSRVTPPSAVPLTPHPILSERVVAPATPLLLSAMNTTRPARTIIESDIAGAGSSGIVETPTLLDGKASYRWNPSDPRFAGGDCLKAEKEAAQSRIAGDDADKLFHLRRALRLCPENPIFHNSLGEAYLASHRIEDAEFEFREALRLGPDYELARRNLSSLAMNGSGSVRPN